MILVVCEQLKDNDFLTNDFEKTICQRSSLQFKFGGCTDCRNPLRLIMTCYFGI